MAYRKEVQNRWLYRSDSLHQSRIERTCSIKRDIQTSSSSYMGFAPVCSPLSCRSLISSGKMPLFSQARL